MNDYAAIELQPHYYHYAPDRMTQTQRAAPVGNDPHGAFFLSLFVWHFSQPFARPMKDTFSEK